MNLKLNKAVLTVYIVILIAGTIFYYLIPENNFIKTSKPGVADFEQDLSSLSIGELSKKYSIKDKIIDYSGTNLELVHPENARVYLSRKDTDDNKIEIFSYYSLHCIEGIDFSERLKAPEIQLKDNRLKIGYQYLRIVCTKFNKDFSITQFDKSKADGITTAPSNFSYNSDIIYIKIPKSLIISNDNRYQYIKIKA